MASSNRSSKARIDVNALSELFEGLRAFAGALPDQSPEEAHHRLFLELVADRGDTLLGNPVEARHG